MSILSRIFGDANERYIKSLAPVVDAINAKEPDFEKLTDAELGGATARFRERMKAGETPDDILPEAFAAVREAAKRTILQRHFDVQLVGGIALHEGKIAEMKTGEGKTLVATLPLYFNALAGRGAHLVTPNDYLSRIGAGWMGPVYAALGMSVGVVTHDFSGVYDFGYADKEQHGDERLGHFRPVTRETAYRADITYGTNNEFGFDYLRDNLEYLPEKLRQRDPHYAIVDEIDSILIDEARTPLIISAPDADSAGLYKVFARLTPQLKEETDYNIDEKLKAVTITEAGIDKVERMLGVGNIYEEKGIRFVRHLEQALRAQALFHRDRDYVVKNGEIIIVDEFTGRLMPGRRWSEGLHQAVEAKEGVVVQQESRTLATITFQNFFRMYPKLAGMTGTAQTSAEEFHKVYTLDVVSIPTHRPMRRIDAPDLIFRTEKGKLAALVREIKERHANGQPVLIGTVSIEKNERLSKMLSVEGVAHEVLNAKNHEREALIIAQAGRKGAVTVATNMAGRGVDIILGGNPPEKFAAGDVRDAGGLCVFGTERHEARRIDNQLRGRSGRQGDSGYAQFYVSLEDDLMRVFASSKIKSAMEALGIPEDQPLENSLVSRALEAAQAKIEGFHFDTRKHVLEFDDVLNKQRDTIYRMRREILMEERNEKDEARSTEYEERGTADAAAFEDDGVLEEGEQKPATTREKIRGMLDEEMGHLAALHTESADPREWNIHEIFESVRAIADAPDSVRAHLESLQEADKLAGEKKEEMTEYLAGYIEDLYDKKIAAAGEEAMANIERAVFLRAIDMLWMDHLDQMEHLRDSVRLRAYGQRDPLVEYKNEGRRLFAQLQDAIRGQVVGSIFKIGGMPKMDTPIVTEELRPDATAGLPGGLGAQQSAAPQASSIQRPSARPQATASRNDPCPCGSGKKYKRCHGV